MRIVKPNDILQRQSENYIKGELSNIASVVQVSQILVDYYSIDADASPTVTGFKNVENFIHENSPIVYNRIENLPMAGIDNLVTQVQFDEELGFDEDLQSSAIIFPNTIVPKPNDCFMIPNGQVPALYVVDNVAPTTVRSNPFTEISFRLFSRDPQVIKQLQRQVRKNYLTTVTAIGQDKTLVIEKENYFKIQEHVENYLDIASLYKVLFYDRERAAFIYDGIYDEKSKIRTSYVDLVLWRLMFDEGIVIFDDVVTYANNNYKKTVDRIYTSCPDVYVDDFKYHQSILWRLYTRDKKHDFAEFKFPQAYEPDPQIGKFTGKSIYYFEWYGNQCDCNLMCQTCPTWDDEFVARIRDNKPYPTDRYLNYMDQKDTCCTEYLNGEEVIRFNPILRNAIIAWYNGVPIDWDNLVIEETKSCENFFLIPLILGAYKKYIHDLQK